MIKGLICIDMDGTLIRGTTSSGHLARWLGHADTLAEYERKYAEGLVNNRDVVAFDAKWYKGVSLTDVNRWLESIPVISGVEGAVKELHDRGYYCVIGTVGWRFVAQWFCESFGIDGCCGPDLFTDQAGRFTGVVSAHFDESDKLDYVKAEAARLGIPLERCVAVGDGRSDVPVFEIVGTAIALNASSAAKAAATVSLNTESLMDILRYIPVLPSS